MRSWISGVALNSHSPVLKNSATLLTAANSTQPRQIKSNLAGRLTFSTAGPNLNQKMLSGVAGEILFLSFSWLSKMVRKFGQTFSQKITHLLWLQANIILAAAEAVLSFFSEIGTMY